MSNKYKGYKKVADHQNYGYTPKQAMLDHNQEKAQAIDKSIVTKPGLQMYSDKQVAELSGEVIIGNIIPERITWATFKRMDDYQKEKYMDTIFDRYPSVPLSHIAMMFGTEPSYLMNSLKKHFGTKYSAKTRKPAKDEEDIVRFKKEMMKGISPLGDKPIMNVVESSAPSPEPTPSTPQVLGGVREANLRCDAKDLPQLIAQLGMVGMVNVLVTSDDTRKESDKDGFK